jgi:hypothetical protein
MGEDDSSTLAARQASFDRGRSGAVAAPGLLSRVSGNQFESADVGDTSFNCCNAGLKALKLLHLASDHDTAQSKQSNPYQVDHQLS